MISGVKALCLWPFVPLAIAVSLTAALYLSAWPLLLALCPPRSLAILVWHLTGIAFPWRLFRKAQGSARIAQIY
jgi:hypothetical protein